MSIFNEQGEDLNPRAHKVNHPLLGHFLTELRNKNTPPREVRHLIEQMSFLLMYEASKDLAVKEVKVDTPLESTTGISINEKLIVVNILRAGSGMLPGALMAFPFASVGHIGIYRDRFIKSTVEYYFRLPSQVENKRVFLCDPLLATGDTVVSAINRLKDYEVGPITFVCLLASPQGLKRMKEVHPEVNIYTSSVERDLDVNGFLLPGIGDAGDRIYGTC